MAIDPAPKRVREILDYDRVSGTFRWRVSRGGRAAGSLAGHDQRLRDNCVYRMIRIDGKLHMASRLAWIFEKGVSPPAMIDHRNAKPLENGFANLRPATASQNQANRRRPSHNKSGAKGVSLDKWTGRYVARIRVPGGKYRNLGRFDDVTSAAAAYASAATTIYGEFARVA